MAVLLALYDSMSTFCADRGVNTFSPEGRLFQGKPNTFCKFSSESPS